MEVIKLSLINYNEEIHCKNGISVRIKDLFNWKTITLDVYFGTCLLSEAKFEVINQSEKIHHSDKI